MLRRLGSENGCLVYQLDRVDKVIWPPQKDSSADVTIVSPPSEQ